jgi:cyclopropane fatty-acyl-phospholipid synthase-like methyltransferase
MKRHRFDLQLFTELNEEYRSRPIQSDPFEYDLVSLRKRGKKRAIDLNELIPLEKKRILEIGCGYGEVARAIADAYDSTVIGIDIVTQPSWDIPTPENLDLIQIDITQEDYTSLGHFDVIYSFTVWEHIKHPYTALKASKQMLASKGKFFISANLYRGMLASHLYREVFFPWPHLLFSDEVFEEYLKLQGSEEERPWWVNKLTAAEYLDYFEELGYQMNKVWYATNDFDEKFYKRFEDVLSRYPIRDLRREFLYAILQHPQ